MKTKTLNKMPGIISYDPELYNNMDSMTQEKSSWIQTKFTPSKADFLPDEILFMTSYPPRECGIATYSQDLIKALNNKFSNSFAIKVCALESGEATYPYPGEVKYILDTSRISEYEKMVTRINDSKRIKIVLIQHEFGFFMKQEIAFLEMIQNITKPVAVVFHTVLPTPGRKLKLMIQRISSACVSLIVMTRNSAGLLSSDYNIDSSKITVIPHGTHLVTHERDSFLKKKYGLKGRKVLTTFGLLSSGKSIETTLEAMPSIIKVSPEVMFLIIGKTHPEVVKSEGERYREMLQAKVEELGIQEHVLFINKYLPLPELLEYLQLTDIYLFTTNDPNQAVSGTFVYAMSCACPIISTPIPHAREVLTDETGIIINFRDSKQLEEAVTRLLKNEPLRRSISSNTLQKIVATAWENSAVLHAMLFEDIGKASITIKYNPPPINLAHLALLTTKTGILQFSRINHPNPKSGYTLDDNARALVAVCMYYKAKGKAETLADIRKYLNFIKTCQQPEGNFLNYMDEANYFTEQNAEVNLDDSNGRALWALGYLISLKDYIPREIIDEAGRIFEKSLPSLLKVHSTRAMAFAIKGMYYYQSAQPGNEVLEMIRTFANRLVQMYRHESNINWEWFEGYLTYANSVLPEALLYAWLLTDETIYREIAVTSLNFLLSQTFNENGIEVISNKNWLVKGQKPGHFGEQPIDVAYTVMTLSAFYDAFKKPDYLNKMETAFNWFLGSNRLHQIIYNPCTGGCYDGLEETHVNLNQGAESTVSYLIARLSIEKYRNKSSVLLVPIRKHNVMHSNRSSLIYSTDAYQPIQQPVSLALPMRLE